MQNDRDLHLNTLVVLNMNKGQNVRRGRTRHTPNKGGGSSNNGTGNRVDSKSRGNPQQNLDKYLGMARDALQAGDRINEEYYLQFAEHFQRVINERMQDDGNRKERSKNNNNNGGKQRPRHQSQASTKEKAPEKAFVDPANVDQPKIVDANEGKPEPVKQDVVKQGAAKQDLVKQGTAKQDVVPSEKKPRPRVARKREPRVKAVEVSTETSSVEAPVVASPEPAIKGEDKAAE